MANAFGWPTGETLKRSTTLVSDGYDGYNAAVITHQLSHAGCWAHARRKFDEVVKAGTKNKDPRS